MMVTDFSGDVYNNDVYYRLYKMKKNGLYTVVCLQHFDENDYYKENFVYSKETNKPYYWESEEEAITRLNEWFSVDEIDEEYRNIGKITYR
jgi:hypothetical protein